MACDLIQSDQYRKVISIGGGMHHAQRRFGEGFCIYNDVAFAAFYLIDKYKLDRIMVLDTDAHAGNGSAEYFRSNPKILYVDIHQDPRTIYPGTGFSSDIGADAGRGFTVNIPMPLNAGDFSYKLVLDETNFYFEQAFSQRGFDCWNKGLVTPDILFVTLRVSMHHIAVHQNRSSPEGRMLSVFTSRFAACFVL